MEGQRKRGQEKRETKENTVGMLDEGAGGKFDKRVKRGTGKVARMGGRCTEKARGKLEGMRLRGNMEGAER